MTRNLLIGTAMLFALAAPAAAANYTFNVIYSGGGMASLAAGSDDPTTTGLVAGDTFTYRLTAAGAGEWTTLQAGSIFPFFALTIGNSGTRTLDFNLNLNNNGSSVFNHSEMGAGNSFAHLGTNTVSFGAGMVWDEYELSGTLLTSTTATTNPSGLLPWPGQGPEQYQPTFIAFNANAVPEPASWALMILGFGAVGMGMRAGRARVRFA
ncbi:PEPxxWA-CTERM sorting domain-containing protein [Sphingomonas sp. MAH-20]|uniref:PEPxxWA-CTERM sorting domain-containing protein n=1 Tax=Sphingomonas horti TaxID=2682842 RepID=A0A6I4J4H5_9SPHN|nr:MULTISPECIES: PEPxxWA-CTERM sorting domain-containing protein [Sphingomonas]MBA2919203.1 PEPxxWA-CTERM sorting domain-containing protein [Sphingomonas sp. CGMCC 1.13658]MVO79236.1 PEPxxWA-CTERM sorting domain-containing protein [Sphingomonas horti]